MALFVGGRMAIVLLSLLVAYSIWKHNKDFIKASAAIGLLLLLVNYLGSGWSMAPIIVGFLFAILALCKIVYDV